MADPVDASGGASAGPGREPRAVWPKTPIGWWALGLVAVGLGSWVVLPVITMRFRDTYPITDTWVMPAIGLVLVDAAAILSVLCVWRWRERSIANVVATILVVPIAILFTLVVVGEGIAGV